jgi:hypothetical protein
MGRRYLRVFVEDLAGSEGWKKLDQKTRAFALYDLVQGILDGGEVPLVWKRVADLRTIGIVGKPTKKPEKETPFSPFRRHWQESWLREKGEAWIWDPRQSGALRTCYAKCEGNLDLFKRRVALLFGRADPWWQEHASIVFLAARWNELVGGKPARGTARAPESCAKCQRSLASVSTWNTSEGKLCPSCYESRSA